MAEGCVIVIFGATGDLTARKLMPAIYNLTRDKLLPKNTVVVGFARRPKTDEEFRKEALEDVNTFSRSKPADPAIWNDLAARLYYHQSTFESPDGYRSLAQKLAEFDQKYNTGGRRLFYLSTSPAEFVQIVEQLGDAGLGNIDPFNSA